MKVQIAMSEFEAAVTRIRASNPSSATRPAWSGTERQIVREGGLENFVRKFATEVRHIRTMFQDDVLDKLVAGHDAREKVEVL